jgi:hypothetical protein
MARGEAIDGDNFPSLHYNRDWHIAIGKSNLLQKLRMLFYSTLQH